ncbi:MAG: FAD-dependent oxidoreductase [Verrucomicrobiota bacterium]
MTDFDVSYRMAKIAVVGAGISGLVAAQNLAARGDSVVVFEKSRSLSGRCATRRWLGHVVDHGAQYFTVSSTDFEQEINKLPQNFIRCIDGDVISEEGVPLPASGGKRYFCRTGNNRIGTVLAADLEVRFETEVSRTQAHAGSWQVGGESFDAVLFTLPWPQTAKILKLDVAAPVYLPCLTAVFEFDGRPTGISAERYALSLRDPTEPLAWSACENCKQGRVLGNKTVFVAQASENFSTQWIEGSPDDYLELLLDQLKQHWELSGQPSAVFSHRWRYARKAGPAALPDLARGLFIAGDSRVDSKIEQVWLDGKRSAQEISSYLADL